MESELVIPFKPLNDKAIPPLFERCFADRFVYQVKSPVNGEEIHHNQKCLPLFFEVIIPFGVVCSLKCIHFQSDGIYCKNKRLQYGQQRLPEGRSWNVSMNIPKQMDKTVI